jgi:hypothetical protein
VLVGGRVCSAAGAVWQPMVEFSRRRALGGAAILTALVASCRIKSKPAGVTPVRLLQIGAGGRVRGVNIGPGSDDLRDDSWTGLWHRWDWNGRIKCELDDAITLGANCVRLIGNTNVVTSNAISTAVYLERWSQFLDYTKSHGLWVYPCGGDLRHWGDTTLDAAVDLYHDWAELLAKADHIVGVDITNEAPAASRSLDAGGIAYHEPESWYYTIKHLGERVRTVSGKPITHSRSITDSSPSWQFGSPETDLISDFLDVHVYVVNAPTDADSLYASDWGAGKQLIIGEFGVDMTVDGTSRTALYNDVKGLINHSANCVGGLAWAIYDTGTTLDSQVGLFDENRRPRLDIVTPFGAFPTTR